MIEYLVRKCRHVRAWVRYKPPSALSSLGWRLFDEEFKINAPIRFWFSRTLTNSVLLPIKWKYESIYQWVEYRTIRRYNVIETGLDPGYCDIGTQLLHASFNSLKNFVEVDLALKEYWYNSTCKASWCEKHMPFYRTVYPFRRPSLGIKHLEWEMTLGNPSLPAFEQSPAQAKKATEILALYKWWTATRPLRIEPTIRHPPGDLCDIFDPSFRLTKEYKTYMTDIKKVNSVTKKWDREDDAMLLRLIKIRRSLWS
jgi:hypothetical protein